MARAARFSQRTFDARPDRLDLRDLPYRPPLRSLPPRYPGDAALAAFADDRCLAAFTPYTGLDYRASHFDIANARPDETTWNSGERHVICALHDADFGELVGSARAAPSS